MRETGGLADTIRDGVNGFTFFDFNRHYFFDAVRRAIDLFRDRPDQWRQMMMTAMRQDFSWEKSAANYLDVYREIARARGTDERAPRKPAARPVNPLKKMKKTRRDTP